MDRYMDGWIDLSEMFIPPVEKKGFQENVILRNKVEPITLKRPHYPDLDADGMEGGTVLLSSQDSMFANSIPLVASVKRVRTGEMIQIDKDAFIIGKGSKADYIVQGNPAVSRQHAMISCRGNEYYIEDMQSTNYTYVEEERISRPIKLTNGTLFKLADELFEFTLK